MTKLFMSLLFYLYAHAYYYVFINAFANAFAKMLKIGTKELASFSNGTECPVGVMGTRVKKQKNVRVNKWGYSFN